MREPTTHAEEFAPPVLPSAPTHGEPSGRSAVEIRIAPPRWERLHEHAAAVGADREALVVAVFAETLRAWAASPDFMLLHRHDDTPMRAVVARRDDGPLAERVRVVAAELAAPAVGAPTTFDDPVVVTHATGEDTPPAARALVELRHRTVDGQGVVVWLHDADVLAPGFVEAAFERFTDLLERIADDRSLLDETRFDLVPAADREVVAATNDTAGPVPDVLLHELLARRAQEQPDAEAVVDGRRSLTYAQLHAYANRIGRALREDGVGAGDLVGIAMEKGWEQYAAVYGVLTAGAAYLPLDAAAPEERRRRLLRTGAVAHVLTQSWLVDDLTLDDVTTHAVDTDFDDGDATALPSVQQSTDLAYVLFTSGSTGEPKGVMVDHRGVVNLVTDVMDRFGVGPGDRAFGVSALHFDASVYDVFGVIAAGATAVLPEPFDRAEPDLWVERARDQRVTVWNSVPAILELVVGQAETRDDRPLASLRLAVVSGDWIPLTLPDRLRAQADDVMVVGSGGPTETICWSLFHPIGDVDPRWVSIPYGKPITNQRYYIVDDQHRIRPIWARGEMAVASDIGLAHGYFGDDERTAASFVTLPETGERAYLTGDLGRWLPDGTIEILGREDFQVKIQGYRIELGEIEAALREHDGVDAAVAVAARQPHGGARLVAFVVGSVASGDEARDHVRALLPRYMVPTSVVLLPELPLTPNGKIDRRTLTEHATRQHADAAPTPAATRPSMYPELEELVGIAVANVLGLAHVGPDDNFYRLGGDSVTGAHLGQELSELLGTAVSLRTVLDTPVVADLAEQLAGHPEYGATVVEAAKLFKELRDAGDVEVSS